MAAYSDNGDIDSILGQSSSVALSTGFNYFTDTEFEVTTTSIWIANQVDNASANLYFAIGERRRKTQAYGAFTAGGFTNEGGTSIHNMKIKHS